MVNLLCPGRRLNVNDTFRKHPGMLLNVSRTFSLRPVHRDSIWIAINKLFLKPGEDPARKFYRDFKLYHKIINSLNSPTFDVSSVIRTSACHGVRNFSENLVCFVFLKHPFQDSPFSFITDGMLRKVNRIDEWIKIFTLLKIYDGT